MRVFKTLKYSLFLSFPNQTYIRFKSNIIYETKKDILITVYNIHFH